MNLEQLLLYSKKENQQFISGGKNEEIDYLKFHYKRFNLLLSLIKNIPVGKLLDIGTTPFSFYINKNTNHEVFAFDYNDLLKERCEELQINFKSGDINVGLPYENDYFDTVIFAEVFEHIHSDPVKILDSLNKVIKPSGNLVFGTPNLASFANRMKLLFNNPILDYPTWGAEVHGHDRLFVKKELVSYLKKAGFNIQNIRYSSCLDFVKSGDESKIKLLFKYFLKTLSFPFRFIFPSLNGTIIITAKPNRNGI
jgi:SAM-dependent methyltransferase